MSSCFLIALADDCGGVRVQFLEGESEEEAVGAAITNAAESTFVGGCCCEPERFSITHVATQKVESLEDLSDELHDGVVQLRHSSFGDKVLAICGDERKEELERHLP